MRFPVDSSVFSRYLAPAGRCLSLVLLSFAWTSALAQPTPPGPVAPGVIGINPAPAPPASPYVVPAAPSVTPVAPTAPIPGARPQTPGGPAPALAPQPAVPALNPVAPAGPVAARAAGARVYLNEKEITGLANIQILGATVTVDSGGTVWIVQPQYGVDANGRIVPVAVAPGPPATAGVAPAYAAPNVPAPGVAAYGALPAAARPAAAPPPVYPAGPVVVQPAYGAPPAPHVAPYVPAPLPAAPPAATPTPTAPPAARVPPAEQPSMPYFFATQSNAAGRVGYGFDLFVNGQLVRRFTDEHAGLVMQINEYLRRGSNTLRVSAYPNAGGSRSPSDWFRVVVGLGSAAGGTLVMQETSVQFKVLGSDRDARSRDYTLVCQ